MEPGAVGARVVGRQVELLVGLAVTAGAHEGGGVDVQPEEIGGLADQAEVARLDARRGVADALQIGLRVALGVDGAEQVQIALGEPGARRGNVASVSVTGTQTSQLSVRPTWAPAPPWRRTARTAWPWQSSAWW